MTEYHEIPSWREHMDLIRQDQRRALRRAFWSFWIGLGLGLVFGAWLVSGLVAGA